MGLFGLVRKNRKGIGLVPVLIVIAIIAVLAIVVVMKKGGQEGGLALPGISSSSAPSASQTSAQSIPAILPAETVAYYTVQNFEQQWKSVTGSNFWKKASALPFWTAMNVEQTVATFKKDVEEGLGFEITESRVFELVGREFAFAVLPSSGAQDSAPQVFFLMRTGMKSKIADTIAGLMDSQQANPRLSKIDYNGTDIVSIAPENEGDPEVRYCFAGDILTFGIGKTEDSLKKIVDLAKSKKSADALAGNANFKEMVSLVGAPAAGENLLGLFFVDMKKVGQSIDSLNLMGETGQVNFSENLKSLKMIGGRIYGKGDISANIIVVPDRDNMTPEVAKLWDVAPAQAESLKLVPAGSLIFSCSSALDVMGMWQTWMKSINEASAGTEMTAVISDFEKNNNISIEKDILSWVGNEASFVFANVDVTGMFPVPELSVVVKVKDQAGAEAFMTKFMAIINNNLSSLGEGIKVELMDRNYGNTAMKVIQIPVAIPGLMPGYMFKNGFLVISTSSKVMEQMADAAEGKSGVVTTDANYKALSSVLPEKNNQMAYINLEKFLDSVIEVLRWVIQFQNMQAGGTAEEGAPQAAGNEQAAVLEQQVVPSIEVFKTFKSVGMSTVYTSKGIEQKIKIALEDK